MFSSVIYIWDLDTKEDGSLLAQAKCQDTFALASSIWALMRDNEDVACMHPSRKPSSTCLYHPAIRLGAGLGKYMMKLTSRYWRKSYGVSNAVFRA